MSGCTNICTQPYMERIFSTPACAPQTQHRVRSGDPLHKAWPVHWSWVLYYCRGLWKAWLWMVICQCRIFAALLQSWLCLLVWEWLVNAAAGLLAVFSSTPVHIPGQFGDFPPPSQPLHLVINWWVQWGSLQQQENHQVPDYECVWDPSPVGNFSTSFNNKIQDVKLDCNSH